MPVTVRAVLLNVADKIVQLANLPATQDDPPTLEGHHWVRESGDAGGMSWAEGQNPVEGQFWDGNNPCTFSERPEETLAALSDAELAAKLGESAETAQALAEEAARRAT
jgi:hypothetical protein